MARARRGSSEAEGIGINGVDSIEYVTPNKTESAGAKVTLEHIEQIYSILDDER
jgi:hypothetical protein